MASPHLQFDDFISHVRDTDSLTLGVGAAVLIITSILLNFMLSTRKHKLLTRVPGYPIVGNLMSFIPSKEVFSSMTKLVEKHGKMLELFVFGKRIIIVAEVPTAKECLLKRPKTFGRTLAFEVPSSLFGFSTTSGVFFAEGEAWSRQRRLTSPAFSHKNVELMSDSIANEIDGLLDRLKKFDAKEIVRMDLQIFLYTIRVISSVAFGNLPPESASYFFSDGLSKDVALMFGYMVERLLYPYPNWTWPYSEKYHTESSARAADKYFSAQCMTIITEARKTVADAELYGFLPGSRRSLVENLIGTRIGNESPLTDNEILSNMKVFFLAGSDTTSVVLNWCIFGICTNDEVRVAIQKEVDDALSVNATGAEAIAAVPLLPLCTACFKEALRTKSPVESLMLCVNSKTAVTLANGIVINPADEVFVHVDSILNDATIFPNPKKFDPFRWLESNNTPEKLKEMEEAHLGFGHGPRVCPGQALARVEGVAALAAMIRVFDFKLACPESEIERVCDFVTKANKMPVHMTRRL
jgi:cytochrome P450